MRFYLRYEAEFLHSLIFILKTDLCKKAAPYDDYKMSIENITIFSTNRLTNHVPIRPKWSDTLLKSHVKTLKYEHRYKQVSDCNLVRYSHKAENALAIVEPRQLVLTCLLTSV